jgi:hypothetical protein
MGDTGVPLPVLPGELRNMIWREVVKTISTHSQIEMTWTYIDEDNQAASVEEHKADHAATQAFISPTELFEHSLSRVPQLFHEFLGEIAPTTMFTFDEPWELAKFSELLNTQTRKGSALRYDLNVAVRIFRFDRNFRPMTKWRQSDVPHGRWYRANEHVEGWINAMQTLPECVTIHLPFWRPWLDYARLRAVTKPLRERGAEHIRVAVQRFNWRRIPNLEMHFKLIADLKYDTLRLDIGEADAKVLSEHGCRGFRGLP